jgi:hypothetical protein
MCVLVLSLVPSCPLELSKPRVVDSSEGLLWDFFENPADLGKNVFLRPHCESGHLALQVTKQEEGAWCCVWGINWMGSPGGFGSGDFLPQPFGIVRWCTIDMQIDASRHLSAFVTAEVSLDVGKNRHTKELRAVLQLGL